MNTRISPRCMLGVVAILAVAVSLVAATPASAGKPLREPFVNLPVVVPAGVACADFDVGLGVETDNQTVTTFFDTDGNPVRQLITGRLVMSVTNLATGDSLLVRLGGAQHIDFNPSGTLTLVGTGNILLILFPTDVPPGPSTTLHSGRVVVEIDPATGFFNVLGERGSRLDVCQVLAGD